MTVLRTLALLLPCVPLLCLAQPANGSDDSRPDILLIMPDQMRGDCLSCLGHPVVRTPHLDRLAQQGTLFRRAYTTVPSCIPARYALLTGLAPQTSGVVGYRKKPITASTLPQLLGAAGYRTAIVGREMHQQASDQQLGYQIVVGGSSYVSDDRYADEIVKAFPEIKQFRPWVESLGLTYNHWQARPWPLPNEWHPTAWIASHAREVVAEVPAEEHLFLTASFYAPHPPLFPPQEQFDYYMAQDLPEPAHGNWVKWDTITPTGRDGGHRVLLQGDVLRRAQAGYFGLIEHLDREIAPLIAEFKARSARANRPWIIAVTADHGEMLGDHGYFRKCEPLEGSANIPMVIAASTDLQFAAGQRNYRPVCLEDFLPTFCKLAGADPPEVDGVNLIPALRGEQVELRKWLHFEHATCYSKEQAFHALTDGRMKYIWRPQEGEELLFDLEQDLSEEHNLAAQPDQHDQLVKWRERLVKRLAPRPEGFSDGTKLIPGRQYAPLIDGVTKTDSP